MRSTQICRELTEKHALYISSGKENVKRERLRELDATKYRIYDSLTKNVRQSKSWTELQKRLHADGIEVSFKTKGSTNQIEGVRFSMNNLSFNGSKVDKMLSYSKIDFVLKQNQRAKDLRQQPLHTPNLITVVGSDDLFEPNGIDPAEEEFRRRMLKKKRKGIKM